MEEMRKQAYFSGSGTRRGYQSSLVATVRLNPLGLVPRLCFLTGRLHSLTFFTRTLTYCVILGLKGLLHVKFIRMSKFNSPKSRALESLKIFNKPNNKEGSP